MLVVFELPSGADLSEYLHVATWKNDVRNEEMDYCQGREKAHEILACRRAGIPYVVLSKPDFFSVRDGAKETQIVDTNVNIDALADSTPLVMRALSKMVDAEALKRFPLFVSAESDNDVLHWLDRVDEKYLKRQMTELTQEQFNDAMRTNNIATPVFLKGVEKGGGLSLRHVLASDQDLHDLVKTAGELRKIYGSLVPHGARDDDYIAFRQMPDWECPYRGEQKGRAYFFEPKDGVMLSDVLDFKHLPDHKAEYRCFIVDGRVSSISTYTDYVSYPVPDEIRKIASEFAAEHASIAPAFVADFGMTDRGPVLVELNSFAQSGRYVGNDPDALYRDLEQLLGVDRSNIKEPKVPVPSIVEDRSLFEFGSKDSGEFATRLMMRKAQKVRQGNMDLG
ncbi:ATP-grasp domain-containing protein [Pseudomonas putida]|uniref:ATP-grasp domain-containing protein n=1 Tax=Pseudomonas putida TaxID=303 RepID=A0A8I1JI03_PSEPU|nr:ATP-grasp domain-containing protein [Pseudomonas putida]MBI6883206.1 ATP-grasp domain-containing protein [Pseudomonas putida]